MQNKEYWYARELAQRVIREFDARPPVDVWKICEDYGIIVATYRFKKKSPGCCFIYEGAPMIFIDDRQTVEGQRFVCAHELGHVLMGHVGAWGYINDTSELPKEIKERMAMVFANGLLDIRPKI